MSSPDKQLLVDTRVEEGILIITIEGRFDHINVYSLKDLNAYASVENQNILLDLSKINYASTSFIHFLISFEDLVKKHGGKLAVVIQSEFVLNVMALTGGTQRHKIFHTYEEALAFLKGI